MLNRKEASLCLFCSSNYFILISNRMSTPLKNFRVYTIMTLAYVTSGISRASFLYFSGYARESRQQLRSPCVEKILEVVNMDVAPVRLIWMKSEVFISLHILKNKEISATIKHKNEKKAITLPSYLKYIHF